MTSSTKELSLFHLKDVKKPHEVNIFIFHKKIEKSQVLNNFVSHIFLILLIIL